MWDHVIGLRRGCCSSFEIALTHDGRLVVGAHAAEGVADAEGFGGFVPALGVATLIGGASRFTWIHATEKS
jgi:hypothetical protein